MTQGEFIERVGKLLYGDRTGWMARLAAGIGISSGHLNNVHKGTRPMTDDIMNSVKALLNLEYHTRLNDARRIEIMLEAIREMPASHLTLAPEPDNNDGPEPQQQ